MTPETASGNSETGDSAHMIMPVIMSNPGDSSAALALPDVAARKATAGWLIAYRSPHTRRAYRLDLNAWLQFCADHDFDPLRARRGHIDSWARTLEADGKQPRTVARHLSSLASWYRYLISEQVVDTTPVAEVIRPVIPDQGETPGLNRDEVRRLLRAAADRGGLRDVALLTVLLTTGVRVNEALSRDVSHLRHDRGHRILVLSRKTGKGGRTVLSPAAGFALDTYLDGQETGPLFTTRTGRRLDQPQVWRTVRRLAHAADIDSWDYLCTHSMRVAFVTGSREAGVPLEDVQDAAGHADPRTTRKYDRGRHSLDRHAAYAMSNWIASDYDDVSAPPA